VDVRLSPPSHQEIQHPGSYLWFNVWLRSPDPLSLQVTPQNATEQMASGIPAEWRYPAENYNHLHEQPTQFYATALSLALMGLGDDTVVNRLAWTYVSLRCVHSLVHSTTNYVPLRFGIFVSSSFVLLGMVGKAAHDLFL
jgi:hypothetical protein